METLILEKLTGIQKMLLEQNMLKKDVLNFNEAAIYLEVSHSHLYKLTSTAIVPFYKPNGKKLYFNRHELDQWLLSKRQAPLAEAELQAGQFQLKSGRR
jgi:excisionase family DNA binding protein